MYCLYLLPSHTSPRGPLPQSRQATCQQQVLSPLGSPNHIRWLSAAQFESGAHAQGLHGTQSPVGCS
ncbi:hypothetical protein CHLRE_10g454951v5 [Chlamydomonas reinhardtii]|uniref:Uncharacterized protein n=1 Tax=Chlamydomonas reinhardtii TaxID=3055 RepID=A0A2K3DBF8_CHLRE|nr:uncharacterized protein CHLRE_10g454951v5 [Chlamydomonas reinhardtii]PNW77866.1 hypothetical protein CHLRE_10g454951v5 [Chlamydomonas reinhardtii]